MGSVISTVNPSMPEHWFSTWTICHLGDHTKFLRGHSRTTENYGATGTSEWTTET